MGTRLMPLCESFVRYVSVWWPLCCSLHTPLCRGPSCLGHSAYDICVKAGNSNALEFHRWLVKLYKRRITRQVLNPEEPMYWSLQVSLSELVPSPKPDVGHPCPKLAGRGGQQKEEGQGAFLYVALTSSHLRWS